MTDRRADRSAAQFADIACTLAREPTVSGVLQRIVDLAVTTIAGCEGAGLLVVSRRTIVAGAWSDERVREIESFEYEVGEGPCLDAILRQPTFESSDLR